MDSNTMVRQLIAMKNDIIDHELKKAAAIENGVCDLLKQALAISPSRGKRATSNGQSSNVITTVEGEDEVRYQAVLVVKSLANAGSAYISPLVAGGLVTSLLSTLSLDTSPSKLVLETLRTLVTIISTLRNDPMDVYRELNEVVCSQIVDSQSPTLESLAKLLVPDWHDNKKIEQCSAVLQLIHFVADGSGKRQKSLTSAGFLDLLASILANWVANNQAVFKSRDVELKRAFPQPIPRVLYPQLVRAIISMIGDSTYRSNRFLLCKDMQLAFPRDVPDAQSIVPRRWESFLPQTQSTYGSRPEKHGRAHSSLSSARPEPSLAPQFMAWLIHMARCTSGVERTVTLFLLATMVKYTNLMKHNRYLSRLILPIMVQAIVKDDDVSLEARSLPLHGAYEALSSLRLILSDNSVLQNVANDANALKILYDILKVSFDREKGEPKKPLWTPPNWKAGSRRELNNAKLLGPYGYQEQTARSLFRRSAVMSALASLAESEDKVRKQIIDCGVMKYVTRTLAMVKHIRDGIPSNNPEWDVAELYPNLVLLSSLELLITLSRSVGMLRTSLIDAKVALPVLELARHPNMRVRVQATDALTNLLLHFSPMKTELIDNGVHVLLCEYTHSTDMPLRISSLWALKHLVVQARNEIKIEVLSKLGADFMMNLLNGEITSQNRHLAMANVRGERVDILNEDPTMEVDGPVVSSDDDRFGTTINHGFIGSTIRNEYGPAQEDLVELRPSKILEHSDNARVRRNDILLQHHALDLIRNMLSEPTDQHPGLVDHVLSTLGNARFFEFIISKFKPKSYSSNPHHNGGMTSGKQPRLAPVASTNSHPPTYINANNYTHADIIISACFVLAHIANGRPAHKYMVITQPNMLSSLAPHFLHPNSEVRVSCLWIVCNVLWVENQSDTKGGRARAQELRKNGIEDQCHLLLSDESQDVQERAKYVAEGFTKLLGNSSGPIMTSRPWE